MNDFKKQSGFTLLELLVAVAIFSIIMTAASGIFVSALRDQERVLTQQLAMSNTSYALEYMGRAMRMAKKDKDGTCLEQSGCNFTNPDGLSKVRFLNHNRKCVEFYLEQGQIKQRKSGGKTDSFGPGQPFTSSNLEVKDLDFKLKGACQADNQQPMVTVLLRATTGDGSSFKIQTTITQRNLDVPR